MLPAMSPVGSLVAISGAEAFVAVVFGGLYFRLWRVYGRPALLWWTRAWAGLLAHLACAVVDGLVADLGPAWQPWRMLTAWAYVASSSFGLLWLALGVRAFVGAGPLPPERARHAMVAVAAVSAAAAVVGLGLVPPPFDASLPEALRAIGACALAAGAAVIAARRPLRHPGAWLTFAGLTALALAQGNYARLAITAGSRGEPLWSPYLSIGDLMIWTVLGLGAFTWLLHQERADLLDATRAHEALRQTLAAGTRRHEALLNGLTERILVVDATGRITDGGRPAAPDVGFAAGDLDEQPFDTFVHPEDIAAVRTAFAEVSHTPGGTTSVRCRVRTKAGAWLVYDCRARNLLHDPAVAGILVTARDVTAQVRLESQLQDARRMESIGRLAGGIAHDFNNLLTVISGNAEMGRASVAPGAPAHDELAQIAAAADRAAALTRQLLSFARRQVVEPRTLDLDGVVAGLEGIVRRLIGGHIELRMSRGTPAPFVRADRVQIEQVVLNLVANARDAMPDGGTLSIATGIIEAGDEPPVAGMPPGRYATLTVSDTGVGMADEVRAHAFEPFFTTKDVGAGTGLGLASCYGIATQHGGFMSVESAHGQGAAFTLYLPLTAAAADETRPAPVAPRPRGHERILLVEDDEAVRRLATRALEASGFSVIAAGDGEEALALVGRSPAIDCVVTDVAMPRLGGAPLVRTIRQGRGRTPVIITSGYVGEAAVDDLLDDDTEFLPKPYAVDELVRRVRTLLDRGASRPPA